MTGEGEVFFLHDAWHVSWQGQVCSPDFNSKGAASAYLDGLKAGRKPEVRTPTTSRRK